MFVVALVIFVPFFAWGLYALHRKYQRQQDLPPWVEAVTLLGVVLFYAVEIDQLHEILALQPIVYVFTLLGLFVAGMALYGHMAISLSSQIIVDIVAPAGEEVSDRPRFSPAEMLERQKDYEGALNEYWILARTYPRHPQVHRRIAECYLQLERPDEAAKWFERTLRYMDDPDKALPVVSRLCELYIESLNQPAAAHTALELFLQSHPNTKAAETARERLSSLGISHEVHHDETLQPLESTPLSEPDSSETPPIEKSKFNKSSDSMLEPM